MFEPYVIEERCIHANSSSSLPSLSPSAWPWLAFAANSLFARDAILPHCIVVFYRSAFAAASFIPPACGICSGMSMQLAEQSQPASQPAISPARLAHSLVTQSSSRADFFTRSSYLLPLLSVQPARPPCQPDFCSHANEPRSTHILHDGSQRSSGGHDAYRSTSI